MWGFEHTAMLLLFSSFCWWMCHRQNYSWAAAGILSQIPFWGGLAAYYWTGTNDPASVNLIMNIFVAGLFIDIATRLQDRGKGGKIYVRLCLIFVVAASVDVMHLIIPVPGYFYAQEAVHYIALLTIGGRAYVKRLDGYRRHHRDSHGPSKGGTLV